MTRAFRWVWKKGIVSTFLAGLFVLLPIAITIGLMSWVGNILAAWFGPGSVVGNALQRMGGLEAAEPGAETGPVVEYTAWFVGCLIVLAAIWLLGLFARSVGKDTVARVFNTVVERVPLVNTLYKPVVQVVGMLQKDSKDEMQGMCVAYCAFGGEGGAGFLGLLVSEHVYHFADRDYQVVYIPTSPVPMSGGIIFAPTSSVHKVDMTVDDLMQIYFSIGVMSSKIIPEQYRTTPGSK
ncbi:DUF502 domain-containing protein [Planctomycetota bacterium]